MTLFRSALMLPALAALLIPASPVFASPALPIIPAGVYNITNYGAIGDGVSTNTTAIQAAINAAAASAAHGGTVEIPAGTFLSGPISFASSINLQLDDGALLRMLPINKYPGGTVSPANFIGGSSLHDVEISGTGAIDGQGFPWWDAVETNSAVARPNMVNFSTCTRVLIQTVTFSNSPSPFLVVKGKAGNVTIQGVTIRAPSSGDPSTPSHNTDAIDLAETNALIQNCDISTGDDNVAVGSSASISADILITNCAFGFGHGVSIGSFTSGGVSNLTVINCTFNGTDNGIRLKSQRDRGGRVQNLSYLNLNMTNVAWPLLIYSYYEFGLGTLTTVNPYFAANVALTNATPVTSTTPIWRNITFSNITATSTGTRPPLMIWGLPEMVVSNVVFRQVNITTTSTRGPGIYNASGIQFIDSSFNLPASIDTLQLYNARLTFSNSVAPSGLVKLNGLTTNGVGNALAFYNSLASLKNTNAIDGAPLTLSASTLTISNHLNLDGSAPLTLVLGTNATTIIVRSNLALNNSISVTNGNGFGLGSYTLFSYGGSFSGNPTLGSTPTGFSYLYSIDADSPGQLNLAVMLPPSPSFQPPALNGNEMIFSGAGGLSNVSYYVLTSTNLALPLDLWTPVFTNQFDPSGNFTFTNTVPDGSPQQFYLLRYP